MDSTSSRGCFKFASGFRFALAGLLLAALGFWGPWVDHFTAALVIPGFDLAEYVKFLPEVRAGAVPVARELFYLPAPAMALCLALLAGRRRERLPWWGAVLLAVLAAALALIVSPPPDFVLRFGTDAGLRAEWGRQALLAGVSFLAVAAALLWASRWPQWISSLLITLSAALGTAIPLWQFFAVRPAIDRVYNRPVTIGWGLWLMPLGFALVVAAAWRDAGSQTHL
ncbi:MAG: hypothetical protein B6I34_05555 [Anaerolineaceae bacterium 4572_32.1]|nr:MAG: hypothetical protein B6I34_05555 [Anaerolineaceae bacterium 4572_32.1]